MTTRRSFLGKALAGLGAALAFKLGPELVAKPIPQPFPQQRSFVFLNGLLMRPGHDYHETDRHLVFTNPPQKGDWIQVTLLQGGSVAEGMQHHSFEISGAENGKYVPGTKMS